MMTIDIEDELRQAFAELPEDHADPAGAIAGSRRGAVRIRRRRLTAMCAGGVASALVIGGAVAVATGLPESGGRTGLAPAGGATTAHTHSASAPTLAIPTPPATTKRPQPKEDTDKPLAGLSGRLLPHGSQLPTGMLYRGTYTYDYTKTWTTSLADGYRYGVPVQILIGADQTDGSPTPAQMNAAYGIVSSVGDGASTGTDDTRPSFRSLSSNIVRFRTPALAQSAISRAQRGEAGLYWVWKNVTTPNVAWSGVPGITGDHGVYDLRSPGPNPGFVAYQVVGSYIVSAHSETKSTAEQGVTDMVANLKTAGLLK